MEYVLSLYNLDPFSNLYYDKYEVRSVYFFLFGSTESYFSFFVIREHFFY